MRGVAQSKWQIGSIVTKHIDCVAKLVQHCGHPALVLCNIAEHSNIALCIYICAEGVLILALLRIERAVIQHLGNIQAYGGIVIFCKLLQVCTLVVLVQVYRVEEGRLLKISALVVPRHKILLIYAIPLCKLLVHHPLKLFKALCCKAVQLVQNGCHLLWVLL